MSTLTVFTPTYNRAYLLPESYETLRRQTCKDFEWLIVDDGSTDQTQQLVERWIQEREVAIRYFKTENRGKPSAINLSIDLCNSDLWVCLDSDDHLAENAVELILEDYQKIKNQPECGGIIGNMYTFQGTVLGEKRFPTEIEYVRHLEIRYKLDIDSDLILIYKTSLLKNYRYPIIEGEKFIGESYLYEKMNTLYYIDRNQLYFAEYREDGLTAGYLNLHIKNPKGYKLLKEQVMMMPKPWIHQFRGAIMYVAACRLCGDRDIVRNSPRKFITALAYLPGMFAYEVKYHKLIKEKME